MPRPVSVSVTASAAGFKTGANQVSAASRQMAVSVQGDASRARKSMEGMESAAKRLAKAERQVADAAGAVRVAESKALNVREKSKRATEDLRAAEQKLAAAKSRGESSTGEIAQAEQELAGARDRSNRATTKALQNSEDLNRASRRLASAQREVAGASDAMKGKGFWGTLEDQSANLDRVSTSMLKVGASAGIALGVAGKAAMDWQSDWAGVSKTVDGSAAELAQLEDQLRGMAKTMPTAHSDIAAVAEAAGQLGVKTQDIASFTKVMVQLGDTTNLTADDAATSLAQFMNVMGTAGGDVDRLGATIVDLGNKGASTERDIVEMGQRIAGAGKQVGLSETDVLGFANALASVGINAEAGGTAISTSFLKIDGAVRASGGKLDVLAKTAGMTAGEFKQAFQDDAAGALTTFLAGLDKVQQSGGDTTAILRSLSITGIRESDALRRLASSGDLLSTSLENGKIAWRNNNALVEEAAKRYATAESRAKIAWNQIKDSTISAGTAMLPVISQVATAIGQIAEFFGELPEPARVALGSLAATVAVMGVIGGLGIKGATGLTALKLAYRGVDGAATGAGRAMKIATLSIPVVGALIFAATTAMQMFASKTTDASIQANSYADAMETVEGKVTRATAAMNENVRLAAVQNLQSSGALDLARQLGLGYGLVTDAALGNKDAINEVNSVLGEALALSPAVSEANSDRVRTANALREALGEEIVQSRDAIAAENQRRDAMNSATESTDEARQVSLDLGRAQEGLAKAQKNLATETQKVIDKFTILRDGALGVERANAAWQESIDAVAGSVKSNRQALDEQVEAGKLSKAEADARARSLDVNTEAGRKNRASITGQITALNDKITADFQANKETKGLAKATDIAAEALRKGRKQIDSTAEGAKLSKGEVKEMQDRMLLTPKELRTQVNTPGMKGAQDDVDTLKRRIRDLESKKISITADFRVTADKAVASLNKKLTGVGDRKISLYSAGGPVWGPGTETSDEIPAMLSDGEFVIKAKSTRKLGRERLAHMNETGELPAFAAGGVVSRKVDVSTSTNGAPKVSGVYKGATDALEASATAYMRGLMKAATKSLNEAASSAGSSSGSYRSSGAAAGFSAEQMKHAATIASVGSSMGRRAQIIGIATAIVESGLRNLNYGDRDSVGLFQQRAPWGSFAARTNPRTSAGMFFHGGRGGQPGLDDIKGWQSMPMGQAAQRVQVSAFPGRYAQEMGKATNALGALSKSGGSSGAAAGGGGKAAGSIAAAAKRYGASYNPHSDPQGGRAADMMIGIPGGRQLAANLVANRSKYGIRYVIHNMQIWSARNWAGRPYTPITNQGDFRHTAHVHASFAKGGEVKKPRLYDSGGWLPPGRTVVQNNTGRNELVLTPAQIKGFASGGPVRPQAFGTSTRYSVGTIVGLIRALEQPIKELTSFTAAVRRAKAAYDVEAKKVAKPKAALVRADRKYDAAVEVRQDVRERIAGLRKVSDAKEGDRKKDLKAARDQAAKLRTAASKTKGITAEDRAYERAKKRVDDLANPTKAAKKLKDAQADLSRANTKVSTTSLAKQKAQEAYDRVAEKAKARADALKEAQQHLAEQQKAVADSARQISDSFRDTYTSKSTDARDWIALMKEGTGDIAAFTAKIKALRKAGLSETLVQQIIGMGAIAGTDVAAQIVKGGKSMVDGLNKANQGIQDAADLLGYQGATGQGRFASGGPVSGPGTGTSDSIRARLSDGEWVVPERAASVPANRRVLEQMTYGRQRQVIERNYAHTYAGGGPVYASAPGLGSVDNSSSVTVMGDVIDPDRILRRANTLRRDKLARRGLRRVP